jgi:predicted PurR-regulated permease PerM|tara:strand:+ start:190 stop:495 length:306 start_codon:yes stop_codon:yes gene_type:complete
MEITSFVLGVLAVIAIMMVAIASVNYMTVKVLRKDIDNLEVSSTYTFEDIYKQLRNIQQELHSRVDTVEQNVVRHTDSRVDKLESKIYSDFDIKRTQSRQY